MEDLSKELITLSTNLIAPKFAQLLSIIRQDKLLFEQCHEDIKRETTKWSENDGQRFIDMLNRQDCTPHVWQDMFNGMYNSLIIQFEQQLSGGEKVDYYLKSKFRATLRAWIRIFQGCLIEKAAGENA